MGAAELRVEGADLVGAKEALALLGAGGVHRLERLDVAETIALLQHVQELTGALAAVQASALVHLEEAVKEDCRRREETPEQALQIARAEASMALKQSKACAGQSMASSRRLVRSMPGLLDALAHGRITPAAAHAVGRTVGPAEPAQRRLVDQVLTAALPHLEGCGPKEWAGEADKVLHALDPDGAAGRHLRASRDRSVTVHRGENGMCTVTARLKGIDGARIRKGLSLAAEKVRAQGDRRGHQQIMADLFADALLGRSDGLDPGTFEIGLIITDRSLFASDHADAATVEGYGPVPFEHARAQMLDTIARSKEDPDLAMAFRQIHLDAEDGQVIGVQSTARRFPASFARFLRISHQTCRGPYCDAGIRQIDHIHPWSRGGPTSLDNGNGLCAGDNLKELAGQTARVITDEDGVRRGVEWTSRFGQRARRNAVDLDPLGTAARSLRKKAVEDAVKREELREEIGRLLALRNARNAAARKEAEESCPSPSPSPAPTPGAASAEVPTDMSAETSAGAPTDRSTEAPTDMLTGTQAGIPRVTPPELPTAEAALGHALEQYDRHAAARHLRTTAWAACPSNRRAARARRRDYILTRRPSRAAGSS